MALEDRIQDIEESLEAVMVALKGMSETQGEHTDRLTDIHKAVTKPPEGKLEEVLQQLVDSHKNLSAQIVALGGLIRAGRA